MIGYFRKSGFTLVELIVVITILAILGSIGFLSISKYTGYARDSSRLVDLRTLAKGLDIFVARTGYSPRPDNAFAFVNGMGGTIYQGEIGTGVLQAIRSQSEIKDASNSLKYTYSIYDNSKYYQLAGYFEDTSDLQMYNQQAYAAGIRPRVEGNYSYDPTLPSLLITPSSYTSGSGFLDESVCFIVNNGSNTPLQCNVPRKSLTGSLIDEGLESYWNMDTTFMSGGLAYVQDLSGKGNHGIWSGSLTLAQSLTGALRGKGIRFDGVSSFLQLQNNQVSRYKSISFLVIPDDPVSLTDSWGKAIYHVYGGSYSSFELKLDSTGMAQYQFGDTTKWRSVTANTKISGPQLITAVYTGDSMKIFVNGKKRGEAFVGLGIPTNTSNTLPRIGATTTSATARYFQGVIDEGKLYTRTLTDDEIVQQARTLGF